MILAFVPEGQSGWGITMVAALILGIGYGWYLAVDQALITQVLPTAEDRAKDLGVINIANSMPQVLAPVLAAPLVTCSAATPRCTWPWASSPCSVRWRFCRSSPCRRVRWLFADQLGPHFLDDWDGPVLLVESRAVLRRRHFHRAKAHLVLSALRHRAAELGDRAVFIQADTYREALAQVAGPVHVVHPTSRAALGFVQGLGLEVLPPRGFATTAAEFEQWTGGKPLMERFYRGARRRTAVLMDGGEPAGGRWNYDADNREPPPRGATTLGVAGSVVAGGGRDRRCRCARIWPGFRRWGRTGRGGSR